MEAKILKQETGRLTSFMKHAVVKSPVSGETQCGDCCMIAATARGGLIVVPDGLGHGKEAAIASETAIETAKKNAHEPLVSLAECCHRELQATRGAAIIWIAIDDVDGTISWLSVGNVDALLLRGNAQHEIPDEHVLMRGGIVGFSLPPLQEQVLPIFSGDTLVIATDGIRSDFASHIARSDSPQQIASSISSNCSKYSDDSLVLVVRYIRNP